MKNKYTINDIVIIYKVMCNNCSLNQHKICEHKCEFITSGVKIKDIIFFPRAHKIYYKLQGINHPAAIMKVDEKDIKCLLRHNANEDV